MAKKKQALVDVEINCPLCDRKLRVSIHRKRLNPVEPPEYEVTTTVEEVKQEELPFETKPHARKKRETVAVS